MPTSTKNVHPSVHVILKNTGVGCEPFVMNIVKIFRQVCTWIERIESISGPKGEASRIRYEMFCVLSRMVLSLFNVPTLGNLPGFSAMEIHQKMLVESKRHSVHSNYCPTWEEVDGLDFDYVVDLQQLVPGQPKLTAKPVDSEFTLNCEGTQVILPEGLVYHGDAFLDVPSSIVLNPEVSDNDKIYVTLSCYCTLPFCSLSWAIDPSFSQYLVTQGVTVEMFASAINRNVDYFPIYCALADPISDGNFLNPAYQCKSKSRYYGNPPFTEGLLAETVSKALRILDDVPEVTFYIIGPYWTDAEFVKLAGTSRHCRQLGPLDLKYGIYDTYRRVLAERKFGLYYIVLSNDPEVPSGEIVDDWKQDKAKYDPARGGKWNADGSFASTRGKSRGLGTQRYVGGRGRGGSSSSRGGRGSRG